MLICNLHVASYTHKHWLIALVDTEKNVVHPISNLKVCLPNNALNMYGLVQCDLQTGMYAIKLCIQTD